MNPPSTILLPHPIKLVPRQRNSYFVPAQSFDIMGMFQNPMMLMMVVGGGMMFALPYITVRILSNPLVINPDALVTPSQKNLDPAVMKDVEETQAKIHAMQNSFQNGGIRAGCAFFFFVSASGV